MAEDPPRNGPGGPPQDGAVRALLERGVAALRGGKLVEARDSFLTVLKSDRRNFDAIHLLGVIAHQAGQPDRAADLIARALEIQPRASAAQNNLAIALEALGRLEEALECFDRAIALKPDFADALVRRGHVLRALGRTGEALASYDRAIALKPGLADAHNGRGNALNELDRPGEALEGFDRAIALDPRHAVALNNRSNILRALGRLKEALESFDRTIALAPDLPDAHNNRGAVLRDLDRPREALACFEHALKLRPDFPSAYNNRGNALRDLRRPVEALESYDRAIALGADTANAFNNRGNALRDLKRSEEALESYERALAHDPDFADAHLNRGNALGDLERLEEAIESFEKATALAPDHAGAWNNRANALRDAESHDAALDGYDGAIALNPDSAGPQWNRALCLLLLGRFEEGWPAYEWRKKLPNRRKIPALTAPAWTGREDLAGKTLYLHWEQGFGDTIQFCRYAPIAARRGARVVFSAQDRLHRLLAGLGPGIEIVAAEAVPERIDYHSALLSLPLAFGTDADTIPAATPYLHAEPERIDHWRARIGTEGFRIGVCWQGNPKAVADFGRSYPLGALRGIAALPGVRLISLQKGDGIEQLDTLPAGMSVETLGPDFDAGPDAFVDTAAAMHAVDLVITSDTSVAHLAGALGRPAWLALKRVPEWRWGIEGTASPWYPSLRLFRQKARGDWPSVFDAMASELAAHLR